MLSRDIKVVNYRLVEALLYNYHHMKSEYNNLKEDLINERTFAEVYSSKSNPGDPTSSKIMKIASDKVLIETEKRLNAVEEVIEYIKNEKNKKLFSMIVLKYFQGFEDAGVCFKLDIGMRTLMRWKRRIVELIASKLGYSV